MANEETERVGTNRRRSNAKYFVHRLVWFGTSLYAANSTNPLSFLVDYTMDMLIRSDALRLMYQSLTPRTGWFC